ncbi:uncharacterized protein ARMOST_22097 [Armillaria ostoyae]|uniref:Uncharacterized protein n=1 Tax=Armillaria ostoyae TaxID=47428 RepID=A0A284SBY8_ARMOS|nr:uncharacterized protein ARMOST_22097 [Armillaria ostoyae]
MDAAMIWTLPLTTITKHNLRKFSNTDRVERRRRPYIHCFKTDIYKDLSFLISSQPTFGMDSTPSPTDTNASSGSSLTLDFLTQCPFGASHHMLSRCPGDSWASLAEQMSCREQSCSRNVTPGPPKGQLGAKTHESCHFNAN